MTVDIRAGDCIEVMRGMEPDSVHCCVTSPPYWGLRDYGVEGQYGMEPTLGEHIEKMVEVFEEVRRVLHPEGTLWLNYGDCYATTPNGRSAADTKAAGTDDRTFRDKPFSTVGPVYRTENGRDRRGNHSTLSGNPPPPTPGRIAAGGYLKPKDLCMIPNRLAIALQEAGWWVRSEIVWGKPNAMPDSSGRYRPATSHEKIFLLTKSAKSFYDPEAVRMPPAETSIQRWAQDIDNQKGSTRAVGKTNGPMKAVGGGGGRLLRNYEPDLEPVVPPEVWRIATAAFREAHFATFPPALVAPCIMAGCPEGGVVLDPFGGSGTVGVVAEALNRESILIDIKPDYCRMAIKRIRRELGRVKSEMEAPDDQGPLFADLLPQSAVNGNGEAS